MHSGQFTNKHLETERQHQVVSFASLIAWPCHISVLKVMEPCRWQSLLRFYWGTQNLIFQLFHSLKKKYLFDIYILYYLMILCVYTMEYDLLPFQFPLDLSQQVSLPVSHCLLWPLLPKEERFSLPPKLSTANNASAYKAPPSPWLKLFLAWS